MSENKQILILKTGHTIAGLLDLGEDFEDWFIGCSGLKGQATEIEIHANEVLSQKKTKRNLF